MGRWEPNSSVYTLEVKKLDPPKQLLHLISEANHVKLAIFSAEDPFSQLSESNQELDRITNCRAMKVID